MNEISLILVSLATWLTASPTHAEGLLVYYGPDWLARANADYRGYSLADMRDNCGLSLRSPSDLGKIVWVALPDGQWYGPCLSVDVGARHDFYSLVYVKREIAEVTATLRDLLQFKYGSSAWGQIYIGLCPPPANSFAHLYQPPLSYSSESNFVWRRWPKQQTPIDCHGRRN